MRERRGPEVGRRRSAARILGAVLVVGAVAAGCAGGAGGEGGGGGLRGRTFLSESVTGDGRPLPVAAGATIRLTFHDDGRLTASAGCNSMGGPVRLDGGRLVVEGLSTTEMGCDPTRHARDEWLAAFLSGAPAWVYEEPRLELRAGGTT
ncbi:MAG: META domain-containing protein, partial [Actinomycetota bacterium]